MHTFHSGRSFGVIAARCLLACLSVLGLLLLSGAVAAKAPDLSRSPQEVSTAPDCTTLICIYIASVSTPDPCQVGQTMPDEVNDVSAAYMDVTSLTSSISNTNLTVQFNLRDVPTSLTFNRNGVPNNYMEYGWEVYVNIDNDLSTGSPTYSSRGTDIILASSHFVSTPNSPANLPIANGLQTNTWVYKPAISGWTFGTWGTVVVDPAANTIRITGAIPGLNADSRLFFQTYDYNPGGGTIYDESMCPSTSPLTPQKSETQVIADWVLSPDNLLMMEQPRTK